MSIKIGVIGYQGRMGQEILQILQKRNIEAITQGGEIGGDKNEIFTKSDVVIDFTNNDVRDIDVIFSLLEQFPKTTRFLHFLRSVLLIKIADDGCVQVNFPVAHADVPNYLRRLRDGWQIVDNMNSGFRWKPKNSVVWRHYKRQTAQTDKLARSVSNPLRRI